MSEVIHMTTDELRDFARDVAISTVAELKTTKSGRIYRRQMVEMIGRGMFDEAVRKGWLMVFKHDPNKANSKMWARIEDWDRFLKIHTNRKI